MSKAIGIDLGTTYSVAAVIEEGRARVIPNAEGENLTPSVVAETISGHRLAGSVARRQASANPHNTVRSIKRHMGTDYRVSLNGRDYSPQEISSLILRKIKADVEAYVKFSYFHMEQSHKWKENPAKLENLYYNAQQDCYICPMGQKMNLIKELRRTSYNGYKQDKKLYQAQNCIEHLRQLPR